jgi:hypothetical protein
MDRICQYAQVEPNLVGIRAINPALKISLDKEEKDESSLTRFFAQYASFLTMPPLF